MKIDFGSYAKHFDPTFLTSVQLSLVAPQTTLVLLLLAGTKFSGF